MEGFIKRIKCLIDDLVPKFQVNGFPFLRSIIPDGRIHRFETENKKKDGWSVCYQLDADTYIAICGDWREPQKTLKILASGRSLTQIEKENYQEKALKLIEEQKRQEAARHREVASRAENMWKAAETLNENHPYLKVKKIEKDDVPGVRLYNGMLIVPMRDNEDKLWGVQKITEDGRKEFLKGQRSRGLFFKLKGAQNDHLYLCEGLATAATVVKASGQSAIVTFSCHNIGLVYRLLKQKYPDTKIIIAADRDKSGAGERAAQKTGAPYIMPPGPSCGDFNDLMCEKGGLDAVKKALEREQKATMAEIIDLESEKKKRLHSDVQLKWLYDYVEKHKLQVEYSGVIRGANHKPMLLDQLMAHIYLQSVREAVKVSERLLKSFFSDWIPEEKERIFKTIIDQINQPPSAHPDLHAFLVYLMGPKNVTDRHIAVFQYFIWQVKRKALGMPVEHHMMPILSGPTGSGKSQAVKMFLNPLGDLSTVNTMRVCNDPREYSLLYDYLVINMDELSYAEKVDVESLKRIITSDFVQHRVLGTHIQQTIANRCTFIGTTNKELFEVIKDPTSARRFFSFRTLPKSSLQANWEALRALDYLNIWRSVDVNDPCPLGPFLGEIQEDQEQIRYKEHVELWADECLVANVECFNTSEFLFDHYNQWCAENGIRSHKNSKISICRKLSAMGFERVMRKEAGKLIRGWHIGLRN